MNLQRVSSLPDARERAIMGRWFFDGLVLRDAGVVLLEEMCRCSPLVSFTVPA